MTGMPWKPSTTMHCGESSCKMRLPSTLRMTAFELVHQSFCSLRGAKLANNTTAPQPHFYLLGFAYPSAPDHSVAMIASPYPATISRCPIMKFFKFHYHRGALSFHCLPTAVSCPRPA